MLDRTKFKFKLKFPFFLQKTAKLKRNDNIAVAANNWILIFYVLKSNFITVLSKPKS